MNPPKRNSLPAWVNPNIFIKIFPTNSNTDFIKPTFKTPIAIISWKAKPIPTVFQLTALRLLLNKKAIKISVIIPKTPRQRLFKENPWLGIIVETLLVSTAIVSAVFGVVNLYNGFVL